MFSLPSQSVSLWGQNTPIHLSRGKICLVWGVLGDHTNTSQCLPQIARCQPCKVVSAIAVMPPSWEVWIIVWEKRQHVANFRMNREMSAERGGENNWTVYEVLSPSGPIEPFGSNKRPRTFLGQNRGGLEPLSWENWKGGTSKILDNFWQEQSGVLKIFSGTLETITHLLEAWLGGAWGVLKILWPWTFQKIWPKWPKMAFLGHFRSKSVYLLVTLHIDNFVGCHQYVMIETRFWQQLFDLGGWGWLVAPIAW